MFEIDDPQRRKTFLAKLGGVEETAFLEVEGERVVGKPEADVDRTTADGKASSVQFIHFLFTDAQVAEFKKPGTRVVLGFAHPEYGHMTILHEDVRSALAQDFAAARSYTPRASRGSYGHLAVKGDWRGHSTDARRVGKEGVRTCRLRWWQ